MPSRATALHALHVMLLLCSLYGMAGAVCEMDVHTRTEFAPLSERCTTPLIVPQIAGTTHTYTLRISHLRFTSPALSVLKLDAPGLLFSFYYVVIVVIRASVTRSEGMVKTRHASELLALQPGDTRRCFSTAEDAKTPNDRMVETDLVRSIRPANWPMTFPCVSVYVCQVVRS